MRGLIAIGGLTNILGEKKVAKKFFGRNQTKFWAKLFFGPNKDFGPKNFVSEKIVGSEENFGRENHFGSKKILWV